MFKKNLFINLALLLASTFVTLMAVELIFPSIFNRVPLELYHGLDEGMRAMAQTSKKSVSPKNYIALMGDSYAEGMGDWLKSELKKNNPFATPDYHSAHVIYRKTGQDVLSFGAGGSGSLRGYVAEPITQYSYINSYWGFTLKKPKKVFVYLYEGNDLTDNIMDLKGRYFNAYDKDHIYEPEYFKNFIQETVLEKDPLYQAGSFWKNFVFCRFLWQGMGNVKKEIRRGFRKLKKWGLAETGEANPAPGQTPATPVNPQAPPKAISNLLRIGGKEVVRPQRMIGGPVEMTEEELTLSVYVFEQAVLFMSEFFHEASIHVVFIPSPASAYEILSPTLAVKSFLGRGDHVGTRVVDSQSIRKTSDSACRKIEEVARRHNFPFLNSGKFIRMEAEKEPLHGPRDWSHLNKKGYHVLADSIIAAFFEKKDPPEAFGCE